MADLVLKKIILLIVIVVAVLLSGCIGGKKQPKGTTTTIPIKDQITASCIELCEQALDRGEDLSAGPCLSNGVAEDWVCDVAHSPRQEVDDDPENQCSAYIEGGAHHFVELNTNCRLIRAV